MEIYINYTIPIFLGHIFKVGKHCYAGVIKKQINYARDNSVDDALDYHAIWNSALISSSDMESAMKAYMEKVSGDFEDLEPKKSFWEKQGLIS